MVDNSEDNSELNHYFESTESYALHAPGVDYTGLFLPYDFDPKFPSYPERDDALTSIEYMSEELDEPLELNTVALPPDIDLYNPPSMKVYITAYFKGTRDFYLPKERDLQMVFIYSPQNYWKDKAVSFPQTHETVVVKRKDPEHFGEIVLDREVSVHAISLEKAGAQARPDALRKRQARNQQKSGEVASDRDSVLSTDGGGINSTKKRRTKVKEEYNEMQEKDPVLRPDKSLILTVMVGEVKFSRLFELRTTRDLNKYRYQRACVELEAQN